MRRSVAVLALAAALPLGDIAAQETPKEKAGTIPRGVPPSAVLDAQSRGRYRVTLNGFAVMNETIDHMLEADGKRDEVYLMADVWELNRDGTSRVPRRSLRTVVMGDVNGQSNPPRIRAGKASSQGGLRTGDRFPTDEPWIRAGAPTPDRLPLLLWEGELADGENTVVILPTVWEWDGPNPWLAYWQTFVAGQSRDPAGERLLAAVRGIPAQLAASAAPEAQVQLPENARTEYMLFQGDMDRPVGVRSGMFRPVAIGVSRAAAERAIRTAQSDKGPGILELPYQDGPQEGGGRYVLYLQIERVP